MDGIQYIRDHSEIRDIILSGWDPLLLPTSILEKILKELRSIKHIEIIRIGTRVPCTLPQRIDQDLCNMLKKYHPIFINTHFNQEWNLIIYIKLTWQKEQIILEQKYQKV